MLRKVVNMTLRVRDVDLLFCWLLQFHFRFRFQVPRRLPAEAVVIHAWHRHQLQICLIIISSIRQTSILNTQHSDWSVFTGFFTNNARSLSNQWPCFTQLCLTDVTTARCRWRLGPYNIAVDTRSTASFRLLSSSSTTCPYSWRGTATLRIPCSLLTRTSINRPTLRIADATWKRRVSLDTMTLRVVRFRRDTTCQRQVD